MEVHRLDFEHGDRGKWRPVLQPCLQAIQSVRGTASQDLDISIAEIPRVSADAQRLRLAARAVAKPHALHTAFGRVQPRMKRFGLSYW